MLKHIRDSEQGIGHFCMQNPYNEQFVGPRGLDDHGRGQALSGSLRALTLELRHFGKILEVSSKPKRQLDT